jgi:hypothetical protein
VVVAAAARASSPRPQREPASQGVRSGNGVIIVTYTPDTTPPVTTITLNPASPNGSNGWYTSASVGLTVSATDQGGSGVAETRCVLDPASVPASFADLPAGPCTLSSVSGDGQHTIYSASTDKAGNVESPVVSKSLKIDSTPPTLNPSVSPNPLLPARERERVGERLGCDLGARLVELRSGGYEHGR